MKIKFLPYQPHCFAFGGFEVQTLSTLQALQEYGVDATTLDVWGRDSNFDVLHCWGLGVANYENVFWGKKAGKKVVITALLPYYETILEKAKHYLSLGVYKARLFKEMLQVVDKVVLVNELQADVCKRLFGVPSSKLEVIPNVVQQLYFDAGKYTGSPFKQQYNLSDFILTTGNVCSRKNQLSLARAAVKAGANLVIIGKVMEGEEKYREALEQFVQANPTITWIKGLEPGSDDLVNAYAACAAFALPSYVEQQPISLLEAAVMHKPLLISDRAYAHQKYYTNARLVNPGSTDEIAKGLQDVLNNSSKYIVPHQFLQECKAHHVAEAYADVYKSLY
ncbi:glycosyltransferase family 4 protein [Pontibacter sp. KCTC 32443]|uniref:glycosyltransferase family 4 protein n=1 Tax=Pontibacter TaxID=323449 RepID=UPI00164D6B50|nr:MULTISPECIES: glycosyltransferase family 4 protein [Pontibacter]MBC5774888.1 glycosyltransferase family 4 protein [Pontibacter sp. KCTC 32443]